MVLYGPVHLCFECFSVRLHFCDYRAMRHSAQQQATSGCKINLKEIIIEQFYLQLDCHSVAGTVGGYEEPGKPTVTFCSEHSDRASLDFISSNFVVLFRAHTRIMYIEWGPIKSMGGGGSSLWQLKLWPGRLSIDCKPKKNNKNKTGNKKAKLSVPRPKKLTQDAVGLAGSQANKWYLSISAGLPLSLPLSPNLLSWVADEVEVAC